MATRKRIAKTQQEIKKRDEAVKPPPRRERPTGPGRRVTPATKRRPTKVRTSAPVADEQLRTSERLTLNRCVQKWHWSWGEKLTARREAPQLRFGTLIHATLEIFYGPANMRRRKPLHPADIFLKVYDEEYARTRQEWQSWRDEDESWHEYRELGEAMMVGYHDHWNNAAQHSDAEYVTLSTEQRFRMPIIVPVGEAPLHRLAPTIYVGTFDRILMHLPSRRLLLGDYKTTKNDPTKVAHLALDEQAGAYYAYAAEWIRTYAPPALRKAIHDACEKLPPAYRGHIKSLRFDGILYDFLKKSMPNESKHRDAQGHILNQPTAKALNQLYKDLGRSKPKIGTGQKGAVVIADMMTDLGDLAWTVAEISKQQPTELFHREPVYRGEMDRIRVLERIYWDAQAIGELRAGERPIKKSPDTFNCLGCSFVDMCELHEAGADWQAYRKAAYRTQDTYSTYNIDGDEKGWT